MLENVNIEPRGISTTEGETKQAKQMTERKHLIQRTEGSESLVVSHGPEKWTLDLAMMDVLQVDSEPPPILPPTMAAASSSPRLHDYHRFLCKMSILWNTILFPTLVTKLPGI